MGNVPNSSDSSDSEQNDIFDDFLDSDDSNHRCRSSSPPPKRPRLDLKYDDESENDESECRMISPFSYKEEGSTIKIKYFDWTIYGFGECDVHDKGSIRSPIFVAGDYNQFQIYFVMDKLETDKDTFFGVYACALSLARSEATVEYKSYIVELRGHKYELAKSKAQKFPRKAGFRFLGSLSKSHIMDEDYWIFRMVPDNDLTLAFKLTVNYRQKNNFEKLRKLFEDNPVRDVKVVVKGKEFPANKNILAEKSPTFAKLLEKDKNVKKLNIHGIEPEVMKEIIVYIYTGRVTKLFTYTDKLLAAADKFKLKDLKAMCKKVYTE